MATQTWDSGDCTVTLDDAGNMIVSGEGVMADYASSSETPWASAYIRSIFIAGNVTHVGDYAWRGMSNILSLYVEGGVNCTIGHHALENVTTLYHVRFGDGVTSIGERAFAGCTAIGELFLPQSCTYLYDGAFAGCTALQWLDLGGIENAGANVFQGDTAILNVYVPASFHPSGQTGMFSGCTGIVRMVFALGVTAIPDDFATGAGFVQISIPQSVASIGARAFMNCKALRTVVIPLDSVRTIGTQAFMNDDNCTTLYFTSTSLSPSWTITSIGANAFSLGTSEYGVNVDVYSPSNIANGKIDSYKGTYTYPDYEILVATKSWTSGPCIVTLNTNTGALSITGNGQMSDYSDSSRPPWNSQQWGPLIHSISIGTGVTHVGGYSFHDNNRAFVGIGSIYWDGAPTSGCTIGSWAFAWLFGVENVVVPSGVTEIGERSFSGGGFRYISFASATVKGTNILKDDRLLREISLGMGSWTWDGEDFMNLPNLRGISTESSTMRSVNGVLYSQNGTTIIMWPTARGGEYKVPTGVTTIGANSFRGQDVTQVYLPDTITDIMGAAFAESKGLRIINIPSSCTNIVSAAFAGCINLANLRVLGPDLPTLGSNVFYLSRNAPNWGWQICIVHYIDTISDIDLSTWLGSYAHTTWSPQPEKQYTVTFSPNDEALGTVSLTGPYWHQEGATITASDEVLTIDGATDVTASPKTAPAHHVYEFWQWATGPGTVIANTNVVARFRDVPETHTVYITVNDSDYGSVDIPSVTVPYGTEITGQNNQLAIGSNLITATPTPSTPYVTYAFDTWDGIPFPPVVEEDMTITAVFTSSAVTHRVGIAVNNPEYGSVSTSSVSVLTDTTWTSDGNTLRFSDGKTVRATPSPPTEIYAYVFDRWEPSSGTVSGDVTITAVFRRVDAHYTVTINVNNPEYGSVDVPSVTADYGTSITGQNNQLAIGSTVITATPHEDTPQYSYGFSGWSGVPPSGRVESDLTVTAVFTRAAAGDWVEDYDAACGAFGSDASMEAGEDLEPGTIVSIRGGLIFASDRGETAVGVTVGEIPRGVLGPVRVHGVVRVTAKETIESGRFVAAGGGGAAIQRITGASLGVALDSGGAGDRIRVMVGIARGSRWTSRPSAPTSAWVPTSSATMHSASR